MSLHKTVKGFYGRHNPQRLEMLQEHFQKSHISKMETLWDREDVEAIFVARYVLDESTLRRFLCWSVRQVWHLLPDERSRAAVLAAEAFADGKLSEAKLELAWQAASEPLKVDNNPPRTDKPYSVHCAEVAAWMTANTGCDGADFRQYAFNAVHRTCRATAYEADEGQKDAFEDAQSAAFASRAAHLRAIAPNPFRGLSRPGARPVKTPLLPVEG